MFQLEAPLTGRRQVARDTFVLSFAAPEVAEAALPGQFVNLLLRPGPLLRRPFSVFRATEGRVEILLRAVGAGTAGLLALEAGDRVSMLGPLGNGFTLDPAWGSVALVSGGLGAAPFPIAAAAARAEGLTVTWVHGARSAADLCSEWEGDDALWATDDGSRGHHGSALDAVPDGIGAVLACGPNSMLAAVAGRWPQAQVAVETYMGCGTGVCLGCAVPLASGGYDRACREGPVYRAAAIDWKALPGHLHYAVGA
ncbi:MAG TPA: FAD-binding oxidoreductase [Candidatus Dormibacteraeota bacterium]|nr:FAD-binding oxidoreductase [Candidatus Dormibacteraeota bacterium]